MTDLFEPTRRADCRPLLADPDDLAVVHSPVLDLVSGEVTGWSAAARFPGTATPDVWFAAAHDAGLAAPVQALLLQNALATRPDGGRVHVPVDPWLLGAPVVHAALDVPLDGVVLELTDSKVDDDAALLRRCAVLRERGAAVGAPAPLVARVPQLPVDVVVLPADLVAGLAGDPRRTAVAAGVLAYAERAGATALADGVETDAELTGLLDLGVHAARGWLVGHPADGYGPAAARVVRALHARARTADLDRTLAGLLRPVRTWSPGRDDRQLTPPVLVLDDAGHPSALSLVDSRTGAWFEAPATLVLTADTPVDEALRRALGRRPALRFDPVPVLDGGRVVGLVRVEDMAAAAVVG
ncbi:EAL domain, c-di-GMP-specific phosphodiesterase class I (or its enzymatically inactive variant) [Klenkia marina]|uniref:EAL domain, c-di-GMP-specific phosphodiesterase class I (Or its enzymatically inactive variant) n=1 Tax=Klenkia marina TaxID=1960309 RepID=A0A1G4XHR6_9ACTN|nr:EAL domain-containing protein [Klenkia marina]SCX40584.1 EAL domain, c-di-GMP-specific phosphodiesterase class I (or its enzymatically inactive variant) [Klenkia marina]